MLLFPLSATDQEDNFVEPDLSKYASIDMSTLRDVRKTGMDYVLLHYGSTNPMLNDGRVVLVSNETNTDVGMYT